MLGVAAFIKLNNQEVNILASDINSCVSVVFMIGFVTIDEETNTDIELISTQKLFKTSKNQLTSMLLGKPLC